MKYNLTQLSQKARLAVQQKDWSKVRTFANTILQLYKNEAEGYFLLGQSEKGAGQLTAAFTAFTKSLELNADRYDSAIELSHICLLLLKHEHAFTLVSKYEHKLLNSPLYLDLAAHIFSGLGLHTKAWELYKKAYILQPEIDQFKVNLAACGVLLGKVKESKKLYEEILSKYPFHQKSHYELSKLGRAKDFSHIEQMNELLNKNNLSPDKNVYLYYAIGKELEDLEQWSEAFLHYQKAGEAILSVANYDVENEIKVIDTIINTCSSKWLLDNPIKSSPSKNKPIFIVGLPRTGTTLTERILASHSKVESLDETFFIQMAIRHASGVGGISDVDENIIKLAASKDIQIVQKCYQNAISYRLTNKSMFIDKYPYNYLYLGFIAKAFPNTQIVYLKRNPLDACFAMFKQSFFKFAYSLEDLGKYYVAYNNLRKHWLAILGDRIVEVEYELLVNDQVKQTKGLLAKLCLGFEQSCLDFDKNTTSSATASTLQVREKIHSRSVEKWKRFSEQLAPLKKVLKDNGIYVD